MQAALVLWDEQGPFDLVLADVVMPGGGGVQLTERLRETHPHLPVLLMTGRESQVVDMIEHGLVPLVKSFTARQLKEIIVETLDREERPHRRGTARGVDAPTPARRC